MEQGTILDRRDFRDRRLGDAATYTGPERRTLPDRRSGTITVCVFCGEVCGNQRTWLKSPPPKDTSEDFQLDVCETCFSKQFTHTFKKTDTVQ